MKADARKANGADGASGRAGVTSCAVETCLGSELQCLVSIFLPGAESAC